MALSFNVHRTIFFVQQRNKPLQAENENADHKDAEDHRGCDMYPAKQEITIEYGEYDL